MSAGKRRVQEIGLPDPPRSESIAAGECGQPAGERGRSLDGIDGLLHAAAQRHVQRTLAWPDLEHPPTAPDTDAIEERQRDRIPEPRLRAKPCGLARSVPE